MRYDGSRASKGDGIWHCPFSEEWVESMKKLVKACERKEVKKILILDHDELECLSEPQDARGLPMSYVIDEERRFKQQPIPRPAIYDYSTIPEIVASNGLHDWPVRFWERNEIL